MRLRKIVSGGQTGVDQAALRAARRLGLETGGWAPRYWWTMAGAAPWLHDFGLTECTDGPSTSLCLAMRTHYNVRDSDATVCIASNFQTPGERRTLESIRAFDRPSIALRAQDLADAATGRELLRFLREHNVATLNVAGNSEENSPDIGVLAEEFLVRTLSALSAPSAGDADAPR